jgi:hypothetical protein
MLPNTRPLMICWKKMSIVCFLAALRQGQPSWLYAEPDTSKKPARQLQSSHRQARLPTQCRAAHLIAEARGF